MPDTKRIRAEGGWIDVTLDDGIVTMAAVGPTLRFLVAEPRNKAGQQRRTTERARYRRMALDVFGQDDAMADAEWVWTQRAG